MTNHQHESRITLFIVPIILAGYEKSCLKREGALPFLEMRCNIFETIYFNPSPYASSLACLPAGRQGGEGEG